MAFLSMLNYLLKMHGYPQFYFWIPRALAKFGFLHIIISRAKNIPALVSTADTQPECLDMRRTDVQ